MTEVPRPSDQAMKEKRFPIRLDFILVLVVIVTAFFGLWDQSQGGLLEKGSAAPEFEFVHHQGGRVKLSDYRGKVVVLDFWATWCPPCVKEMPWLVYETQQFAEGGVVFLAASHDEPAERVEAVNKFLTKIPTLAPHVVYSDPEVARRYGVVALPTLYIIGRNGKIIARARGEVNPKDVRSWIAEASRARD